jgi:uncharacterized coiled-coil DUF342 family protein
VTKLKMNITTKEDYKAENGRLKRELEVREKAIKDLDEFLKDSVPKFTHDKEVERLKVELEDAENKMVEWCRSSDEYRGAYHKEHSLVIQLDGEVENLREQLRQAREESVKYGKENEHLWGLLKIKMEG